MSNRSNLSNSSANFGGSIGASDYYTQKFNLSFYSPYLAASVIKKRKRGGIGISLKSSYNIVGNYDYYQRIGTYQGKANPTPLSEETLTVRPRPFVSLEPALNFYFRKDRSALRFQLGYNYRYSTLKHNYHFYQENSSQKDHIVHSSTDHPTLNPISINVCLVIYFKKKQNKNTGKG